MLILFAQNPHLDAQGQQESHLHGWYGYPKRHDFSRQSQKCTRYDFTRLDNGHAVYALLQAKNMADYKAISQNLMHGSIKVTDSIYAWLDDDQVKDRIASLSASSSQPVHVANEVIVYLNQLSKSELKQAIRGAADLLAG